MKRQIAGQQATLAAQDKAMAGIAATVARLSQAAGVREAKLSE